jgi:hypothetical protein
MVSAKTTGTLVFSDRSGPFFFGSLLLPEGRMTRFRKEAGLFCSRGSIV